MQTPHAALQTGDAFVALAYPRLQFALRRGLEDHVVLFHTPGFAVPVERGGLIDGHTQALLVERAQIELGATVAGLGGLAIPQRGGLVIGAFTEPALEDLAHVGHGLHVAGLRGGHPHGQSGLHAGAIVSGVLAAADAAIGRRGLDRPSRGQVAHLAQLADLARQQAIDDLQIGDALGRGVFRAAFLDDLYRAAGVQEGQRAQRNRPKPLRGAQSVLSALYDCLHDKPLHDRTLRSGKRCA